MLVDTKYSEPRIILKNYWQKFLELNKDLIPNEWHHIYQRVLRNIKTPYYLGKKPDYHFKFDGYEAGDYDKIIGYLKNSNVKKLDFDLSSRFIFYYITEGESTDEIFDLIYWFINLHQIDYNKVTYLNIALNVNEIYDRYCQKNNIKDNERFVVKSQNIMNNHKLSVYAQPNNLLPEYPLDAKFFALCLNWAPRYHRMLLIGFLLYYNVFANVKLSVPTFNKFGYDMKEDSRIFGSSIFSYYKDNPSVIFENFNKVEDFRQCVISRYRDNYPFIVDDRSVYTSVEESILDYTKKTEYQGDVKQTIASIRRNSLFEIVNETYAHGPIMLTEKTYWPILAGKPFFNYNSKGALLELKKYGYKTFEPYIDESYDLEENMEKRAFLIVNEFKRLYNMRIENPNEFYHIYNSLIEIANYNKEIFLQTGLNTEDPDFIKS